MSKFDKTVNFIGCLLPILLLFSFIGFVIWLNWDYESDKRAQKKYQTFLTKISPVVHYAINSFDDRKSSHQYTFTNHSEGILFNYLIEFDDNKSLKVRSKEINPEKPTDVTDKISEVVAVTYDKRVNLIVR